MFVCAQRSPPLHCTDEHLGPITSTSQHCLWGNTYTFLWAYLFEFAVNDSSYRISQGFTFMRLAPNQSTSFFSNQIDNLEYFVVLTDLLDQLTFLSFARVVHMVLFNEQQVGRINDVCVL